MQRTATHWLKRGLSAGVLSIAAIALTATAAFAHECKNESRNLAADARAAAGNGWTLTSDVVFMFILPDEIGVALTPEQLAEAQAIVAAEKASGLYDAIYAEDRALLDRALAMGGAVKDGYGPRSSDDRGIDHVVADFAEIGPLLDRLVGIYLTVLA